MKEEVLVSAIIPNDNHAYNVSKPETNNDEMQASKEFYDEFDDNTNVHFNNQYTIRNIIENE